VCGVRCITSSKKNNNTYTRVVIVGIFFFFIFFDDLERVHLPKEKHIYVCRCKKN
jgi:hypothetical protein